MVAAVPALAEPYRRYLSAVVQFHIVAAAEIGLAGTDFQAANLLQLAGPLTSGELAHRLALTTGATTRLIDRLAAAGWVRRAADPSDRRRVVVELSGLLPERLSRAVEAVRSPIGAVIGAMSEEQREGLLTYFEAAADAYAAVARQLRDDGVTR